jgi:hypothetical protein
MAVVQNTLIGRARGRVGNVVFSTHKGQNILKQKPEIVANPRTASQQLARARFTALLQIGLLLRPLLPIGFRQFGGQVSWLNKFMSINSASGLMVLDTVNLVYTPDWNNLVISDGSLYPTPYIGVADGTDVTLTWWNIPQANQSDEDIFFVFISGTDGQELIKGEASRVDGTIVVPMVNTIGSTLYAVGFFMNPTTLIVSPSFNLEIVVA